jgi:hypothetical protein
VRTFTGTGKNVVQKFSFLKDMSGNPLDSVGIKVELKEILVIDNTISFGNTETVS